ncbi:MAG: hypothetical protein IPO69_15945 [Saprospiraceae bacterium]|nr:hypothetical protein [Saprospiraceae bacterium]
MHQWNRHFCIYPSGAKYSGQFVASQIQGLGTLWMNNGNTYSGQWVKNYREGQGKMIFKNERCIHRLLQTLEAGKAKAK